MIHAALWILSAIFVFGVGCVALVIGFYVFKLGFTVALEMVKDAWRDLKNPAQLRQLRVIAAWWLVFAAFMIAAMIVLDFWTKHTPIK